MRLVHGLAVVFVLFYTSTLPGQDVDSDVQKWLQQLGTREAKRFQALNELIKLGEKSIEPTRQLLNDKDEHFSRRWQAAKVLGALKAKVAVPDLVTVVEGDDNVVVKMVAAEALRIIGDRSVVPKLKRALTQEKSAYVKRGIKHAIALLDDTPGDDVDPESQELLNALGPLQPVQAYELHGLGEKAIEKAIERFRRVLNNKMETVPLRSQAAMVLGKSRAKAAVPELLDIVEGDETPFPLKAFAAQALAKIGDWEAIPRLEKALAAEENATIKLEIQSVVAELSGMKLMELRDDVDADVRRWLKVLGTKEPAPFQALNELIKLGEKSIEPARIVLSNESELYTRRWQAAKVLGALKAKRAMPELLTVVEADDHRVVTAVAAEALGRIGDRSVLPRLKRALEEERDPYVRPEIEQAITALENG